MNILISGEIEVDPARRDQALRDAVPLIDAALAERGCVQYAWSADLSRPGRIHVFEAWDSEADLAAHLAADPYRNMAAHLASVGIVSAETRKHRVTLTEPVYDPDGKPRADFFTAI